LEDSCRSKLRESFGLYDYPGSACSSDENETLVIPAKGFVEKLLCGVENPCPALGIREERIPDGANRRIWMPFTLYLTETCGAPGLFQQARRKAFGFMDSL
jgi:hypothetical protein